MDDEALRALEREAERESPAVVAWLRAAMAAGRGLPVAMPAVRQVVRSIYRDSTAGRHYVLFGNEHDDIVTLVDTTAGAVTVVLPAVRGRSGSVVVKKTSPDANAVLLESDDLIDGARSQTLTGQYDTIRLVPADGMWRVT